MQTFKPEVTKDEYLMWLRKSVEEHNEEKTMQLVKGMRYIDWERVDENYEDEDHGYGKIA